MTHNVTRRAVRRFVKLGSFCTVIAVMGCIDFSQLTDILGGSFSDVATPAGGAGQPVPGAGFFDAEVVNESSTAADVTLRFLLVETVVHETVLRRVAPGTTTVIAGPELATMLVASGTREDGAPLPEERFLHEGDADTRAVASYVITDPVSPPPPPPPPPPPAPPVDTNGPPNIDTSGPPDTGTTGEPEIEPPPSGGGGGGGSPSITDCNSNGIEDADDIANETSADINTNSVPDECEADCNTNSLPDDYDIAAGSSLDCDTNGMPDECDIAGGTSDDANTNGVPDECEVRTLAGWWRFEFVSSNSLLPDWATCNFFKIFATEIRYMRFDRQDQLVESWAEVGGQYLKFDYPQTNGPSYYQFRDFGWLTMDTTRTAVTTAVPGASSFRLEDSVLVSGFGSQGTGSDESGIATVDAVLDSTWDTMVGEWNYVAVVDTLCGHMTAQRLAGPPPALPTIIDFYMGALQTDASQVTTPGTLTVTSRSYVIAAAPLPAPITIGYYRSLDFIWDANDTLVGSEQILPGPAGTMGQHTGSGPTLNLPIDATTPCTSYLLAVINPDAAIAEWDSGNNSTSHLVTIAPATGCR